MSPRFFSLSSFRPICEENLTRARPRFEDIPTAVNHGAMSPETVGTVTIGDTRWGSNKFAGYEQGNPQGFTPTY